MRFPSIKKAAAPLLALVLISAVGAGSALAAAPAFTEDNSASTDEPAVNVATGMKKVDFHVWFDIEDTTASRPATQFSYTISPVTGIAATETEAGISNGVAGGAYFAYGDEITHAWDEVNSAATDDLITISFDTTKFSSAGIYRYKITQTPLTQEQQALNIVTDTADKVNETRFLDVFVSHKPNTNTLIVTGAALFKTNEAPTMIDKNEPWGVLDYASYYGDKTDGFRNHYTPQKLTLKKLVDGAMGDESYIFPFTLSLDYASIDPDDGMSTTVSGVKVDVHVSSAGNIAEALDGFKVDESYSINLKHDETVEISGIPATVLVKLKENIEKGEGYQITSEIENLDNAVKVLAADKIQKDTEGTSGAMQKGKDAAITYTNTRETISATGVVLNAVPYIVLIGMGGIFLVAGLRKSKKAKNKA